jgi:hypothetical protein
MDSSQAEMLKANKTIEEGFDGNRTAQNFLTGNDVPKLMDGKSIDLASDTSKEYDFDQYIKNREKNMGYKTAKS